MESIHVANSILEKSFMEKKKIGHLALQKLLYFTHAWYSSITQEECLDEPILAAEHGPIVPSIYEYCRHVGKLSIDEYLTDSNNLKRVVSKDNQQFYQILNKVWNEYSALSPIQLSAMANQKGTPWEIVKTMNPNQNMEIPNSLIVKIFTEQAMSKLIKNQKPTTELQNTI